MPLTLDIATEPYGEQIFPAPAVKTCTGLCGETKALEEFGPRKTGRLGREAACKPCRAAATRERREDPAVKAAEREYKRRYYEANAEALREYQSRYREANAEARREYRQRPETKAARRLANHRRRAQQAAATVEPFTTADLHAFWDEAGYYACYWCDCDFNDNVKMHVDHLVPLARGGAHAVENLVPACSDCNQSKSAKDPYAFALERYPWLADLTRTQDRDSAA